MSDSRLQEIVTRAVVGRAERRMSWSHTVPAEAVTGVLGVHVVDAAVGIREHDGRPVVDVIVDCDLWCGNSKHTKVIRCTSRSTEAVDIRTHGQMVGETDLKARLVRAARAIGVSVSTGDISLQLEADVSVEVSALSRMWVKAYDLEDDVLDDLDDPDDDSASDSSSGE